MQDGHDGSLVHARTHTRSINATVPLPLLDACHRTTTTTSACEVDHLEVDLVEI
jgi:hypothetical protein